MYLFAANIASARASAVNTETFSAGSGAFNEVVDMLKAITLVATKLVNDRHPTVDTRVASVGIVSGSMLNAKGLVQTKVICQRIDRHDIRHVDTAAKAENLVTNDVSRKGKHQVGRSLHDELFKGLGWTRQAPKVAVVWSRLLHIVCLCFCSLQRSLSEGATRITTALIGRLLTTTIIFPAVEHSIVLLRLYCIFL
jgi:hypothetical protein